MSGEMTTEDAIAVIEDRVRELAETAETAARIGVDADELQTLEAHYQQWRDVLNCVKRLAGEAA